MKKINFFLLALSYLMCMQLSATAQGPFSLGVKAGVSIPNLKSSGSNPLDKGWESRSGPCFGIVAMYNLSNNFALTSELNFSSQGGKRTGAQAIPNPNIPPIPEYLYANFKNEAIINYAELPVMLNYKIQLGGPLHIDLQGGFYGGILLRAKNVSSGESMIYLDEALTIPVSPSQSFDHTTNIKDELKSFNYGLQFGAGAAYDFHTSTLRLMAGGNYGLTSIQKDKANGDDRTGALTVCLAYLVNL